MLKADLKYTEDNKELCLEVFLSLKSGCWNSDTSPYRACWSQGGSPDQQLILDTALPLSSLTWMWSWVVNFVDATYHVPGCLLWQSVIWAVLVGGLWNVNSLPQPRGSGTSRLVARHRPSNTSMGIFPQSRCSSHVSLLWLCGGEEDRKVTWKPLGKMRNIPRCSHSAHQGQCKMTVMLVCPACLFPPASKAGLKA